MYRVCTKALKHFNLPKDLHARKSIIAKNMREVWPGDSGIATPLFFWEQQRNYWLLKSQTHSKQWRMSSVQELTVWVQTGQQNARQDQNLLHFLLKGESIMRTGRKGGRKLLDKGHSTCGSATVRWTGGHRATQSNRSGEKAVLQTKSHRKQLTRGTHSHQQMHNVALPSNTIYDTPQLYTLRMTALYLLIQAESFLYSLFHIISLQHLSSRSHSSANPLHRSMRPLLYQRVWPQTNLSCHNHTSPWRRGPIHPWC